MSWRISILALVVQLGRAFTIGAIGFGNQFLPLPGDRREQLTYAPGDVRQVGGGLGPRKLGHHGVERLLIVVIGGEPGGQRLGFRGVFLGLEGREGLPGRHHAMVVGPGAFQQRPIKVDNVLVQSVGSLDRGAGFGLRGRRLRGHQVLFRLAAMVAEDPLPLGLEEPLVVASPSSQLGGIGQRLEPLVGPRDDYLILFCAGENPVEPVVIANGDRIILVIMAAGQPIERP